MENFKLHENTPQHDTTPTFAEEIKKSWSYKDYSYEEWQANGFLLTKEGLPSKLDRELQEHIHTPEFKAWFGDWETEHAEGVSAFIDRDTGEPQVFFRGDKSRYKEGFAVKPDTERTLASDKAYGFSEAQQIAGARNQGVFFTNSKEVALGYGSDINSETLGKYGLDEASDHPETFPEMVAFIKSIEDAHFWRSVVENVCNRRNAPTVFRRNFDNNGLFKQLSEVEKEQLWETVVDHRLRTAPVGILDAFIRIGALEWLAKAYLESTYANPDESFSSKPHAAYGSWSEYAPESSRRLNDVLVRYQAEPLVLSRAFLRAQNPKEGKISDFGFEPHNARLAGHDAYVQRNGVGGGVADEVIIFEPGNIWTVSKESLSRTAYQSSAKKYQP
ncbi:MAG: hypothetical protein KBD21_05050 [Candidatus Pacebacteria bacterium]|nr:hypothetical protein [Candidatus Paceibacterota bacterium]